MDSHKKLCDSLKAENERLQKLHFNAERDATNLTGECMQLRGDICTLKAENDRLRDENARLKNKLSVVRCGECKHARESEYAVDSDCVTPLFECDYMTLPSRGYEFCSYGERM